MKRTTEAFAGYECVKLENGVLTLWVTQDVGPRIIGLAFADGEENLLAVVPEAKAVTPAGKTYHFRGGHRLWYAPEDVEVTYVPDDSAVTITPLPNGIQTTQAVEPETGILKEMTITLAEETAVVTIDHELTNQGSKAIDLAPWAITQLRPGGFAILPQPGSDSGLLPNRRLAFWPYTQLNSAHLTLGDRFIFVQANMTAEERFKIGWPNPDGWLAYWVDGTLFVKEAAYDGGKSYFDFDSSSECYCDGRFLELETLGPRTILAPGDSVSHREIWRLFRDVELTAEPAIVTQTLTDLQIIG
jgi:hypothetical protein